MEYTTLYEAWKKEKENDELQRLDKRFYIEISEHIKANIEKLQMLDDKTLSARLANEELGNIERLFKDLMLTRYNKISKTIFEGKNLSIDLLTSEEELIYRDIVSVFEKIKTIERNILRGRASKFKTTGVEEKPTKVLVRFLQNIPSIVGLNTKIYGPFKVEDVAFLPIENAENLIKSNIAVKVEIE